MASTERKLVTTLVLTLTMLIGIFLLICIFKLGYQYGTYTCNPPIHPPSEKPNFLVFLADDMGYGDLSSNGHPTIKTPNIDALAFNGMRLTQFYANPMCSPTRSAIMTGRDPIRNGAYNGMDPFVSQVVPVFYPRSFGMLPTSEILVSDLLHQQGYFNGAFGKWHLGSVNNSALPLQRGFDRFWGIPYSTDQGCPPGVGFPCLPTAGDPVQTWVPVPLYRGNDIIEQPTTFPDFMPRLTEEVVNFLEEAKENKKPFFAYVPYFSPHVPLFTAPEFYNTSTRGLYGDVIQELDHSVGVIINKLEELHLSKDTLVVFTSDNGPATYYRQAGGSAGLFRGQKGTTWEGGVRVPSIWYWPGRILKNTINHSITSCTDIFTTLVELAGGSVPSDRVIDGLDLSPILFSNGTISRQCIPYYTQRQLTAMRCGAYKLVYFQKRDMITLLEPVVPNQLYNLNNDPSEQFPLNNTLYSSVIDQINNYLNNEYLPSLVKGPSQFQYYNPAPTAPQPCCKPWNGSISNCYCPPTRTFGEDTTRQLEYASNQFQEIIDQAGAFPLLQY